MSRAESTLVRPRVPSHTARSGGIFQQDKENQVNLQSKMLDCSLADEMKEALTAGSKPSNELATVVPATAVPVSPFSAENSVEVTAPEHYRLPPPSKSDPSLVREDQLLELRDQGFPSGLAKALASSRSLFPLRIWVVDNSGSMLARDGSRLVETTSPKQDKSGGVKMLRCTRWAELQQCVNYHSHLSCLLRLPTTFRFLNEPGAKVGPQQFGIAERLTGNEEYDSEKLEEEVHAARDIIDRAKPRGTTPLTKHVQEICLTVQQMKNRLIQEGEQMCIILATDGLPTDENGNATEAEHAIFIEALRSLEGLPVWIVVRLCTDEHPVVHFYNSLDAQLELSIEVLEDIKDEVKRTHKYNKWLNYALPLHRAREMGFHDRVFDMLDERRLTVDEVGEFCFFLFGADEVNRMRHPAGDWEGFVEWLKGVLEKEKLQWNPVKKTEKPWIDIKALEKMYGKSPSRSLRSLLPRRGSS